MSNAQLAYQYLTGLGLSPGAATGVVGNLVAESGVNPGSVQPNGPGRGIAQWSAGGRWDQLQRWAASRGLNPGALTTQLQFMVAEMQSMGVWRSLQQTSDVTAAATIVMRSYEMPKDQSAANGARRAKLGVQAVGGSAKGSGSSDLFPTLGPSWAPWNWPADAGNAAAGAAQSTANSILSGVGGVLTKGLFLVLGVGLIGYGVVRLVAPRAAEKVEQALPLAAAAA